MKGCLTITLLFLALCVLLGSILSISLSPPCDLESLLLQDSMMPDNWSRLWRILPPALPKDGAADAINVVYENGNEIVQHTVYRYNNGVQAYLFLRINNQSFFPSGHRIWSELEESNHWPLHGDEAMIQCSVSDDALLGPKCDAVIRYGLYISEFSSPIEEGTMSPDEFEAIVIALDERIIGCIQSPTNRP